MLDGVNPVYTAPADLQFAAGAPEGAAARPPRPLRGRDVGATATGTSRRPTSWRAGATPARSTARCRSSSRSSSRSTRARAPTRCCRPAGEPAGRDELRRRPPALAAAPSAGRLRGGVAAGPARRPRCPNTAACRRPASAAAGGAVQQAAAESGAARVAAGTRGSTDRVTLLLPARSDDLGRPLRHQRLAPGAAQADHQAGVGQRPVPLAGHGRAPEGELPRGAGRRRLEGPQAATPRSGSSPAWRTAPATLTLGYGRKRAGETARAGASTPTRCAPRTPCGPLPGVEIRGLGGRYRARLHAEPPPARRPRRIDSGGSPKTARCGGQQDAKRHVDPHRHPRRVPGPEPGVHDQEHREKPAHGHDHVPALRLQGARLGHGDRPERLHRLQLLRGRLPGGEQHPGGGQGPGAGAAARCTGCASTATSTATSTSRSSTTSRSPACTARTPRARWSARWRPRSTATRG